MSGNLHAVSLFSGIGGLDLGARLAGLQVVVAVDRDEAALELLHRAQGTRTVALDFDHLGPREAVEALGVMPGTAEVVFGGPPCTPFSHAGFWIGDKRHGRDPAVAHLDHFIDTVRLLRPRAFVLENVPGLAFKTHAQFLERLQRKARAAGFSVGAKILNAAEFGVPQARRRLFVVGIRGQESFTFPLGDAPRRSAGWAIADLADRGDLREADEVPVGAWAHLLEDVPPGRNYLVYTSRHTDKPVFRYRGRYWSFLLKIDPNRPAPTLPAQRVTFNGPFHWQNRHLRLREMARLQSFPDWYPLSDDCALARRHIGNAVPPLLAASVMLALRRHLRDGLSAPPWLKAMSNTSAPVADVFTTMRKPNRQGRGREQRRARERNPRDRI